MENKLPKIDELFFNVVKVAIDSTAWKRVDFDKVALVEGQLIALANFYKNYYQEAQAKSQVAPLPDPAKEPEPVAPVEIQEVEKEAIEALKPEPAEPNVQSATDDPAVPVPTPMPDAIQEIVKARVEAAKNAKPINKNVKISESALPEDVSDYIAQA